MCGVLKAGCSLSETYSGQTEYKGGTRKMVFWAKMQELEFMLQLPLQMGRILRLRRYQLNKSSSHWREEKAEYLVESGTCERPFKGIASFGSRLQISHIHKSNLLLVRLCLQWPRK